MAPFTLRPTLVGASIVLALLLAACGGGDSDNASATPGPGGSGATPIPTAGPLTIVPAPTILDTSGASPSDNPVQDVAYVVAAGDSLSRIAAQFGTTVEALQAANDLADTNIFIGQELTIPGASGTNGTPATPTPRPTTGIQTYVVQAGDSGFGIALQFDTTLEALAAANGLSVDDLSNLQIGQELLIPAS